MGVAADDKGRRWLRVLRKASHWERAVLEGPTRSFDDSFGEHISVELILCARPCFRCSD